MKDLTIIIPIHEFTEASLNRFKNTVTSINNLEDSDGATILVVGPKNVTDSIDKTMFSEKYKVVLSVNQKETDYATQVMHGVEKTKTKLFSVVGYDDYLSPKWVVNIKNEFRDKPDTSAFLSIVELLDGNNNSNIGLLNEPVWASTFSEVMGYLDMECLKTYYDFNLNGAVFDKDDFLEVGGLKPSIKLTFWYEFLLRFINAGKKAYVIPKIIYKHYINYEGSLMTETKKNMKNEEGLFWLELAKKEYVFPNDRKKEYTEGK